VAGVASSGLCLAFALLLIVGYQNLVVLPRLSQAAHTPRVLASTSINLLTYDGGTSKEPVKIHPGRPFS